MVVGDGREDEKVFKWANALGDDGIVGRLSRSAWARGTREAKATLTQGVSGTFFAMNPPLLTDADGRCRCPR